MNPRREEITTFPEYYATKVQKYSRFNAFFQYSEDEIWLGASNTGVYYLKYDSENDTYVHQQFLSSDEYSISDNNISFIISDEQDNIWFGGEKGLNLLSKKHLDDNSFVFQQFFKNEQFNSASNLNGKVWFGTENSGLVIYDLAKSNFTENDKFVAPIKNSSVEIVQASNQQKLIIGASNILYIYDVKLAQWKSISIKHGDIQGVYEDRYGFLWVTTLEVGIYRINQKTGVSKFYNLMPADFISLSDLQRPFLYEDKSNDFWICTHGGGLAKYSLADDQFIFYRNEVSNPNSISSNTVTRIVEDHNNTLWVGTGLHGGINKIVAKNSAVESLKTKVLYNDFVENIIRSVEQDVNGNIWFTTKGGKIQIVDEDLNPKPNSAFMYPFKPIMQTIYNVYAAYQDSKGHIWLGSKGAGIAVSKTPVKKGMTDYSHLDFYVYTHNADDNSSLGNNNIYDIVEDNWGNIWIGTYGNGISKTKVGNYGKLQFTTINTDNSNLTSNLVRNILFDRKNQLWVCTAFGLNYIQNTEDGLSTSQFKYYLHDPEKPNSLSYNDVVHAFEDQSGQLWFGTFGGGVNQLLQNSDGEFYFNVINREDGLINDEVFSILEDDLGFIWFATESGLSRYDKSNESFDNYNRTNGLGSSNFSENTCLKLQNGELIFGGNNGVDKIDPTKIQNRSLRMDVIFTNFQLFNKDVDLNTENSPLTTSISYSSEIILDHEQSSFSLEFSAMNFLDPNKTQYAYYLEGFEKGWNSVGSQHKATYTNLKPGNYTFRVKSDLWNGKWTGNVSELKITILPPWWRTTYAYITYLVIFFVITYLTSRVVIRTSAMRNELKIEKAVNQVKLQFFTNISHEIRTPLTLILGPIEDILLDKSLPDKYVEVLRLVQKNGRRMLHLLNQLLDFRKIQNKKMILKVQEIDMVDFVKNVFENFEPMAKHKHIDYYFHSDPKEVMVYADPNRMDSVIFNVLSNAFKFTPKGKEIAINVTETDKELMVSIKDGGPGLKSKDIPLIFDRYSILQGKEKSNSSGTGIGLNFSNEIVKMHGGEIKVLGNYGSGCEFIVVLKKGNSHFPNIKEVEIVDATSEKTMSHILPLIPDAGELELLQHSDQKVQSELPSILIVEDNQQIVRYIKDGFKATYNVIVATNGEEAINVVERKNPDIIISDIMMPVMDGIEMTKKIKDNFDTCHIPVILLTAKSGVDNQIEGHNSGAEAYVLKPFNMKVLHSMVDNMLVQRKLIMKKYRDKGDIELTEVKITSRDQEFIDNLVKHIEKNYSDSNLSINSLAEFSCVSRTVFYNKVKGLTGISPVEFMRQIKLKIAAKMLEQGYNVSEAALNIGFNDTRYFSRQFKELFGESPSQYKKRFNA